MKNPAMIRLTDEDLAKINGGTEVLVLSESGERFLVIPPDVFNHDEFNTEQSPKWSGKNVPGGNEDIWDRN